MTHQQHVNVARRPVKACLVSGLAGLLLVACGGGGGDAVSGSESACSDAGAGRKHALAADTSHALACSTNGLSPGALNGDALNGLGSLNGMGIAETSPADKATDVAVTVVVRVTFSKAMAAAPGIIIRDPAGRAVSGRSVIDGANILFTPSAPLASAVTYNVVVDGGQSVDGDVGCGFGGLGGPCHLEFSFTTR